MAGFVINIVVTGWAYSVFLIHNLGHNNNTTFYGVFVTIVMNAVLIAVGQRELRRASRLAAAAARRGTAFSCFSQDQLRGPRFLDDLNVYCRNRHDLGNPRVQSAVVQ